MKSVLVALLLCGAVSVADNCGFSNCDFEKGVEGWGVWYSDDPDAQMTRYPFTGDDTVAHGGKHSLKLVAPDEDGRVFVSKISTELEQDKRYEVSWWVRKSPELDEARFSVRFIFRPADPEAAGWRMKTVQPVVSERKTDGEWHYRRGTFRPVKNAGESVTLGLYLNEALGTLWIDDVKIREINPEENRIASLWVYDPHRVELGRAPMDRYKALVASESPLIAMAKRYNELLVKSAFAKEDVRRWLRARHHDGLAPSAGIPTSAAALDIEDQVAELYKVYGETYTSGAPQAHTQRFEQLAGQLENALDALQDQARERIAALTARHRRAGEEWAPPPAPLDVGTPSISADGRVNQLIFGNRSLYQFQQMETPLLFDPVHSTTVGNPGSDRPGHYNWSPYEKQWDDIRASGIPTKSCLLLFLALHDGCYMPAWLWERARKAPEILHQIQDGELNKRGNRGQLNWWHPDVQDYAREIASDMGRHFRDRDEFLFYVFQWECYGPYAGSTKGRREVGYGEHATASFRAWLRTKYETIAQLNERWGTEHTSFEALEPPPDRYVVARTRTNPLAGEWEAWREHSYTEWCKLIYQAWKTADPDKPVLAGHSGIYRSFSMPDVFETCDMLGFHSGAPTQMLGTLLINSMSRYNGHKPVCQYENFWGIQEHHDRMFEELPQRHSAQKYIFRLTAWNRFMQIWWYSYTPATYLTNYDGNYFDPSYGLTTLRYRTAALPVYFQKFRRLQRALLDSRIVPSRICMLSPTASMRCNVPFNATQTEAAALYKALFPAQCVFEFVPEEYFTDGRADLADFDVLILPYALYLPAPLQERISTWLAAEPRLLLSAGPFGLYDDIGCGSAMLWNHVFPGKELGLTMLDQNTWQWTTGSGKQADLVSTTRGPSRIVTYLRPMVRLAKQERNFVRTVVSQVTAATDRAVYDDDAVFEMVLREQGETRVLCIINPSIDDAAEGTVHVQGTFSSVVDLDYETGHPISATAEDGETHFPIRLEPGEATLIRLTP
ncbi:MAG: hypothetical protein HN742_22350 [Lentisphaerae bacterium]|jgi:hypothetical protein|nr:hypothetical protein [Lentisphaerota bacterium]MBT4814833.1 hypothetical protein [Lentisphaerota bacterium]MBT7055972.1 hypothetical protein [Lentisphaerota bacterium]MBT7844635.1 hypothetical protein [Lentisphaerota bacterium]